MRGRWRCLGIKLGQHFGGARADGIDYRGCPVDRVRWDKFAYLGERECDELFGK
jgi:hypothetical protein